MTGCVLSSLEPPNQNISVGKLSLHVWTYKLNFYLSCKNLQRWVPPYILLLLKHRLKGLTMRNTAYEADQKPVLVSVHPSQTYFSNILPTLKKC